MYNIDNTKNNNNDNYSYNKAVMIQSSLLKMTNPFLYVIYSHCLF